MSVDSAGGVKRRKVLAYLSIVTLLLAFVGDGSVRAAIVYCTPTGSTLSDGPVDAQATFTLDNGIVTVVLTNLEGNPTSSGQLISGIRFAVADATGSGLLTTTNSGLISTIEISGSYLAGSGDSLTRWEANEAGTTVTLSSLSGGQPNRLIIGPDSAGGFTGAGTYSNANASIGNFNPSVLGTGEFAIGVPGVGGGSGIGDVAFLFGTEPAAVPGEPCNENAVPEPVAFIVWSCLGAIGAVLVRAKKRSNRSKT
ncbi:MAG: hypothetical protein LLG00_11755 [Planctomycetaceae bacterium]|nr:hypothetical protein [Planctomycetaceae bacterium]